jgi:hypothetical protein
MNLMKLQILLPALMGCTVLWLGVCLGAHGVAAEALPADIIRGVHLSDVDLRFGRQQLDQMLRDRPSMAVYVQKGEPIYEWCVRQFAGSAVRQHIYWSSHFAEEDYTPDYLAYHLEPGDADRAAIVIRDRYAAGPSKGQPVDGSEAWSCLVFELFKISHTPENPQTDEAADTGAISKATYIERSTRTEFDALVKTRDFYRNVWKPMLIRKGLAEDKEHWEPDGLDSYEHWMSQFTDPGGYPFDSFGRSYDEHAATRRNAGTPVTGK